MQLKSDQPMFRWRAMLTSLYTTIHSNRVLEHARQYRWVEVPVLAALLLWLFCTGILSVPFHPDESQWIATSKVFEVFVRGDRASPVWDEGLWTLTQPPGARYLTGLGRRAGGYQPDDLNRPWTFGHDHATNVAVGAMPEPDLLWWSRLPMVILAVAACLVTFGLLATTVNRTAAYIGLVLLACNPFVLATLRRAMAEAPLLVSLLLATYAGVRVVASAQTVTPVAEAQKQWLWRSLLWLLAMSVCIGVAGSMKLNGLTALVGAMAVWTLTMTTHPTRHPLWLWLRISTIVGGYVLIVGTTALTFVDLNPYLDPDPLGHTLKLIAFRANEIQKQQADPTFVIDGFGERIVLICEYLFRHTTVVRFPGAGVINAVLWTAGAWQLLRKGWHTLRHTGKLDQSSVLLLMAVTCAGPTLLTPLNWDRYFLLPVWFSTLLIAAGAAWGLRSAGTAFRQSVHRREQRYIKSPHNAP